MKQLKDGVIEMDQNFIQDCECITFFYKNWLTLRPQSVTVKEDINITNRLAEAGKMLGFEVLDSGPAGEGGRRPEERERG